MQPASEVYADLLVRPSRKVSYYGTCKVGIIRGMPIFWVEGMYGSVGHSGYPKNPASGDGTGHLQGCHNEHSLTGLCSYSDVAERAKQTLLYAVKNDVCTNYYHLKQKAGTVFRVSRWQAEMKAQRRTDSYSSSSHLSFSINRETTFELVQLNSWRRLVSRYHRLAKATNGLLCVK